MNQQFILGRVVAPILLAVCLLLTFAPVTNLSKGWDDVIEQFEREIFGDYMVDEFDDNVEEMPTWGVFSHRGQVHVLI